MLKALISLCFKPASRCLLFSKMNSRRQNCSKLSFYSQNKNASFFLSICGEKISTKDF